MRNFIKVILHGNLTADAASITTKTGRPMSTFSVATNYDLKTKDGKMVRTADFHRIVAFGKLAEVAQEYFKKGQPVLLSGRLHNSSYKNEQGEKRYFTEVVMDDFNFLARKEKSAQKEGEKVAA